MSAQPVELSLTEEAPESKLPPELEDIERIIADPELYTLKDGTDIRIVRIRTRQLMRLVKILTHGFSPLLTRGLDLQDPNFQTSLLMQIVLAIPDAEKETIEFLRSMCEPAGIYVARPGQTLSEDEMAFNAAQWGKVATELFNPDPGDLLEIIERIIQIEAPEIQSLGKQAARLMKAIQKVAPQPVQDSGIPSLSPDLSQPPSTLSAPSTGGPTTTSSTSRSAASARSSTPSASAAT